MPKALVSTLYPISGGVPQMAAFIANLLKEGGYETTFVYYEPYSLSPDVSVPLHRLASRRVGSRQSRYRDCRAYAIGAWLPELEFTHYWPTRQWRDLIDRYDVHLSVSGNCLAAAPFALNAIPFWSWVATDWAEDRVQRVGVYPWYRKILDRLITAPGARTLEKRILGGGGTIVALSEHTKRVLSSSTPSTPGIDAMPMGVDTNKFRQFKKSASTPPTIGFVGRLDDPRKNVDSLLKALVLCRKKGVAIRAMLVGEDERQGVKNSLGDYELADEVTIVDYVENDRLPEFLSQMDVFVIPSHQEGLCIAALEAMSCSVPVITTRCGGPEEYVINGETGYVVDPDPESVAVAVLRLLADPILRESLGRNARRSVEKSYSATHVEGLFWSSFNRTFKKSHASGNDMGRICP